MNADLMLQFLKNYCNLAILYNNDTKTIKSRAPLQKQPHMKNSEK